MKRTVPLVAPHGEPSPAAPVIAGMGIHEQTVKLLYRGEEFQIWDYACPGCDTHEHGVETARSFDISFPRHGLYQVALGGRKQVVNPNHIFFFNRGDEYRVSHPVAGKDVSTVISLRPAALHMLLGELRPRQRDVDRTRLQFERRDALVTAKLALQHRELLRLVKQCPLDHLAIESATLSLCETALNPTERHTHFRPATERDYRDRIEHLKTYIYAHLGDNLRLADVAREVAFSPFHLTRVFRQMTGVSIHRYMQALRLHQSLESLSNGRRNLTELAFDLGYPSHSHFTERFRSFFGVTPSLFRSQHFGN